MQARDGRGVPQPRRAARPSSPCASGCARCSPPAQRRNGEIREMLGASFAPPQRRVRLQPRASASRSTSTASRSELQLIESNYVQYLGLTLALRLAQPKFMEQFRRMLRLQAARRLREREQRARALEQGGLGAGRRPAARAPQGVQAAQRDAREDPDRRRRARAAHRRDRGPGRAPAAVPGAHRRARRGAARARLRRAARDRRRARQDRPAAVRRRRAGRGDASSARLDAASAARARRD